MKARQEKFVQSSAEVIVTWRDTVMAVAHLTEGQGFTLGDGADFEFAHPAIPAGARFTVAEIQGGRVRVAVPGVAGWTRFGEEVAPIEAGDRFQVIELDGGSRAMVELGELVVHCGRVAAAPPVSRRGTGLMDRDTGRSLAAAAAVHAVVFVMASALPLDAATLSADSFDRDNRFVEILYAPEKPEDRFQEVKRGEAGEPGTAGAPESDEPPTPKAGGAPVAKGDKKVVEKSRAEAREQAKAAAEDAIAALNGQTEDVFSDRGPLSDRAALAMNEMFGRDDGTGAGLGGDWAGLPGAGPGRGPGRTIGAGNYATCKDCDGPGGRYGRPNLGHGQREPKAPPRIVPRDPTVIGGLSKEEIQRVIRRNRAQYQFCYEKDLKAHRDLAGKLVIKFTIGPNGQVIAARTEEDTLGADVGECVLGKVRRWQFPAVPGGGIVNVRYPFLFKASS